MFQILLALHILAAVVFVGNIITVAFWKVRADRSGSLEAIATTTRAIIQADFAFTTPGITVLMITGIWMTSMMGWDRFQQPWLGTSFVLLVITGIIWLAILIPQQQRMARLAEEAVISGSLGDEYQKVSRRWAMFGGIATLLPIVILFLMVLKPGV